MLIADEASDTEAQAARDAAARLQEVVREADTEAEAGDKSPREALESLGRELAFRPVVGPVVLAITQIALWAACRSDDVLGDAFVDHFTATRRWEVRQFRRTVTDWELKRYMETV